MLNILQLFAAILRYCPEKSEVVLLDRPDAGLDGTLSLKLMDALRRMQEELGIQMILTSDSETVLRDADPSEVLPVIAGAKVNRPLWTKSSKCAKPVDKPAVENQMDLTQAEEEKEMQEAQTVSEKIDTCLDAYDLAQVKCSGKLALCALGRKEIAQLKRIGMAVHAPAFAGRAAVPVVQAECGADRISGWAKKLSAQLGREIEVYAITQELRPVLETAWERLKLRRNGAGSQSISGYAGEALTPELLPEELRTLFALLAPGEEQETEERKTEAEPEKTVRRDAYEQLSFPLE